MSDSMPATVGEQVYRDVEIHDVVVPSKRHRRLRDYEALARSINLVGLQNPITVTAEFVLVSGLHRLNACKSLGWETIPSIAVDTDELSGELREIDENLIREDLTILEQGKHLARRMQILEAMGQRAEFGMGRGNTATDAGFYTTADIAKEMKVSERTVRNYIRVGEDITEEAADIVNGDLVELKKDTPYSTGQLLELAKTPAEHQADVVSLIAARDDVDSVWSAKRVLAGTSLHFSSESAEWYTPREIVERVLRAMGEIDLDPCSNEEKGIPAGKHYTELDDGLAQSWRGRVYMNPPYGRKIIDEWTGKLLYEFDAGNVTEAVALVPARTDTQWFVSLNRFPICFVTGRLKFSESENSASFPSALFYLGPNREAFISAFKDLGDIFERVSG